MSFVSIHLCFKGNSEEAFNIEFSTIIMRMGDMPPNPAASIQHHTRNGNEKQHIQNKI